VDFRSGRRRLTNAVANDWTQLKTLCEAGGIEVALSESFDASKYSGLINFSGKTCKIIGQGQVLDAKGAGRFFYGSGAGSSLEVHGLVLKNGMGGDGGGGAIKLEGDIDFEAIYLDSDSGVELKFYDSTFESNTASSPGGAIYAVYGARVEIHTSEFKSNKANVVRAVIAVLRISTYISLLQFRVELFLLMAMWRSRTRSSSPTKSRSLSKFL
jgi:predicted outer membrane repeat protein